MEDIKDSAGSMVERRMVSHVRWQAQGLDCSVDHMAKREPGLVLPDTVLGKAHGGAVVSMS